MDDMFLGSRGRPVVCAAGRGCLDGLEFGVGSWLAPLGRPGWATDEHESLILAQSERWRHA